MFFGVLSDVLKKCFNDGNVMGGGIGTVQNILQSIEILKNPAFSHRPIYQD